MPGSKKNRSVVLVVFGISFLAGCDMIENMFSTSPAPLKSQTKNAAVASQAAPAEEPVLGTVLVRINNAVITLEGFDEKVKAVEAAASQLGSGNQLDTLDAKKTFLDELVKQELLVQEARARGIDRKKEVKDAVEEFKKSVLSNQVLMDETRGIAVEPSEIEGFYNRFQKEFAAPEEIRAREIVVSSEATAREILIGLLQGGDFAAAARERSIAPTASKGGDAGVVKREEKFDKYIEVVSTLEPGQISQFFKGPDGYYIVKVEEKKGGTVPPLAEVYEQIKQGLTQQKAGERIRELTDKLKREAKIEVKEDLLR